MVKLGGADPLPDRSRPPWASQPQGGDIGEPTEQHLQLPEEAAELVAPAIRELAGRAFDAWREARERVCDQVVTPSMPILYFGDFDAYRASDIRVVTVGLNPSLAEFPVANPFSRFRSADDLKSLASTRPPIATGT
jgi:hypothetical protein